jgi:molybdopterin/thiamine biosynthesis adenylyltransferase
MRYTFTFYDKHYESIKHHLLREDGKERAAFIICGRSSCDGESQEERFLSKEVFLLTENELIRSEEFGVTWDNRYFIDVLRKAEEKNLAVAIVHNHPTGYNQFSLTDDEGEYHLFKLAFNRNEGVRPYASLIMMPDGSIIGRVWKHDLTHNGIDLIRVLGDKIELFYPKDGSYRSPEFFQRQKLAFGEALIEDLSKLRIGVVGCGATGSAVTMLLARLGVKNIFLIDKDIVEATNLNRLHGARISDIGKYKVDVLKKYIEDIGLGTSVEIVKNWITSLSDYDSVKSCDMIFGCTDDHSGRIFLNRLAYFYLIPVIDMGLHISIDDGLIPPKVRSLQGRVTFLFPGRDCLITNGVINPEIAYAESLKRDDLENYMKLKEEAYVIGEGNPNPAVITFTTEIATIAVNELLNRLTGYNKSGPIDNRLRQFHQDNDIFPSRKENTDCKICGSSSYWGRGDMIPFLDMSL